MPTTHAAITRPSPPPRQPQTLPLTSPSLSHRTPSTPVEFNLWHYSNCVTHGGGKYDVAYGRDEAMLGGLALGAKVRERAGRGEGASVLGRPALGVLGAQEIQPTPAAGRCARG